MVQVKRWDAKRWLLGFELLKALHDERSFRVSRAEFPPGARFPGGRALPPGTCCRVAAASMREARRCCRLATSLMCRRGTSKCK
jgi:hypothetical protein